MKCTPNYGLNKPEQDDFYDVKDFNDNADIIDQALKAHDDALATKETPQGAQEKADAALNSAKQYTDQEVGRVANDLVSHKNDNTRHISANIPATAITFGGKFQIAYNSVTNSLDITVVG